MTHTLTSSEVKTASDQGYPEAGVFNAELGVFIINETTRLALEEPAELGWRLEKAIGILALPSSVSPPAAIAA